MGQAESRGIQAQASYVPPEPPPPLHTHIEVTPGILLNPAAKQSNMCAAQENLLDPESPSYWGQVT